MSQRTEVSGTPASGWIAIVSGLPRSGTSLMMSMLRAGGMPILSDDRRAPDAHNPRGYFELEAVKNLPYDASWLREALGKAVKVQAYLLPFLPDEFDYRVVFMHRMPEEIAASQERMLRQRRPEESGPRPDPVDLMARHLAETEAWLASRSRLRSVHVDYTRLVASPLADAHRVNAFFDGTLDVAAMQRVVDPRLYRQRGRAPAWSATGGGGQRCM